MALGRETRSGIERNKEFVYKKSARVPSREGGDLRVKLQRFRPVSYTHLVLISVGEQHHLLQNVFINTLG